MNILSTLVKVTIPNYLAGLPIPDTVGGWFRLGVLDWLSLVPLGATIAGVSYLTYEKLLSLGYLPDKCCKAKNKKKDTVVNLEIQKNDPKVVDNLDIEEIGDKKIFCRCWRSKNFPYCDGAHNQHNASTGDNVGPLIIGKKSN